MKPKTFRPNSITLSLQFDDETFFKLASIAGVAGTELPDKMEKINQIMEVAAL